MGRLRLNARQGLLVLFALATLLLIGAGVLTSLTLLRTSLDAAAKQDAEREARLVADLGLSAALSHGHLSRRDLRLAGAEYEVAHHDLPLTGVILWMPSGRASFVRGSGKALTSTHSEPGVVRAALRTGKTQVTDSTIGRAPGTVEAAVPLGARAHDAVAEFPFARGGIQQNLDAAKSRLYLLSAAGALIMFLAILPLLARLADRIPLPADPVRRHLLAELRTALSRREFVVHYQPKVEIASGGLAGVEALVRWNHPRHGLLPPSRFLPAVASSPQLLTGLTCQVLDTAARDCAAWLEAGHLLPVAVNVAPAALLDPALVRMVRQTLDRHDLAPRMLTLELTENALMEPGSDVTAPLHELRALGLSVSIDDFGTGNSSLARLRTLPLDEIKIDRSLIACIATDDRDLGIARHIVHLGMDLGLRVVAEGVEDERTLRVLRTLDCEIAQGFHLSKPLPEEELRAWIGRDASGFTVGPLGQFRRS